MSDAWDQFSKSLGNAAVPRRESLRLLGAALAGAFLGPLGLRTAWGANDPCRAFCRCVDKRQRNDCLQTCRACNNDPSRLCGTCYRYTCCAPGTACCPGYGGDSCVDLAIDDYNCGACGNVCDDAQPYEYGECVEGACYYDCIDGAVRCDETCTSILWDPDNCGACGNVCPASAPDCNQGTCSACAPGLTLCGNVCAYLPEDPANCGACGHVCPVGTSCLGGYCQPNDPQ